MNNTYNKIMYHCSKWVIPVLGVASDIGVADYVLKNHDKMDLDQMILAGVTVLIATGAAICSPQLKKEDFGLDNKIENCLGGK